MQLAPEQQRRQVALRQMTKFADKHGCTDRAWREIDQGDVIAFVGKTDEGREFCLSYQKETEQERLAHA